MASYVTAESPELLRSVVDRSLTFVLGGSSCLIVADWQLVSAQCHCVRVQRERNVAREEEQSSYATANKPSTGRLTRAWVR